MIDIEKILKTLEDEMAEAYLALENEENTEKYFQDQFWRIIEENYAALLKEFRNKYTEVGINKVPIEELLYDDADDDRIKKYYDEFKNAIKNLSESLTVEERAEELLILKYKFLTLFVRIVYTEVNQLINNFVRYISKEVAKYYTGTDAKVYVKVWMADDESDCGAVSGGDYFWEDVDFICDHPNCDCYLIDVIVRWDEAAEQVIDD